MKAPPVPRGSGEFIKIKIDVKFQGIQTLRKGVKKERRNYCYNQIANRRVQGAEFGRLLTEESRQKGGR